MPDSTQPPAGLYGVALMAAEDPTGLRTTYARVPAADLHRVRDAVDTARRGALSLPPGGWEDVLVVWGRPGRRPLPEALTAPPDAVEGLRVLLLELDR